MIEALADKKNNVCCINYGIKVFPTFDESLVSLWQELYDKGANYNLSPDWCRLWLQYFGKNKEPHIITFWEDRELKLLAPFYVFRNRLSLIGTKPDLYDEFNILYTETRFIDNLLEYIEQSKLEVNFKHLNTETEFAKHLIKRFSGKSVKQISCISETKPFIKGSYNTKHIVESDVKRCKKNVKKQFGQDYAFEYSVINKEDFIDEFIKFHTYRWNGGMFIKKANLINFVKNVLKTDLTVLSRLYLAQSDKTAAYGIGYLDSNNKFWLSISSYNHEYKKISPGKVILYDLITECFDRGIKHFDFGRGSEAYKNWFANDESILFNIQTYDNSVYVIKIRNLIEKILRKISG